ncbi:hypothetical protein LCGC14_2198880, partial [marine sediment metagenome]
MIYFRDLNDDDFKYIESVHQVSKRRGDAQRIIAEHYGITTRGVRKWVKRIKEMNSPDTDQVIIDARKKTITGSRYILTWAQENTPVHREFFKNIEALANEYKAEIAVIAGRYKNNTSKYSWGEEDPSWATEVLPYLTLNRHNVHKYLSILADVKILPTAMMPMTGFEGFESEVSIIIGHPKVQMKIVPTLEGYRKKEIFTTGSCTLKNYRDSRIGKKGEFHHTLGFVVAETDGDEFYMRHVTAKDDGSFMDLNYEVCDGVVNKRNDNIALYSCGDKHFGETDTEMEKAGRKMILKFKPDYVRLDDIFNGHSINPHEDKNPVKKFERFKARETILDYELDMLKDHLVWYNKQDFKIIIPRCNHDIFLDRYISSKDWKRDIPNALTYMQCATVLLEGKAPKGLIPYFINQWYPDIITLTEDESYRVQN